MRARQHSYRLFLKACGTSTTSRAMNYQVFLIDVKSRRSASLTPSNAGCSGGLCFGMETCVSSCGPKTWTERPNPQILEELKG